MRLAVPMWLRALASSVCMFVLVVLTVAFSISNATIAQATTERSIFLDDEGSLDPQLVVGFTPEYLVTLRVEKASPPRQAPPPATDGESAESPRPSFVAIVEMTDRPTKLTVFGRQSIIDYMLNAAPKPER